MPCFVARGVPALLAALTLLEPAAARAAPNWRLVLLKDSSVADCVRETELQSAVVSRLGYDPFASNSRGLIVTRLARQDAQLMSSVELFDESGASRGKRELTTAAVSCDDMTRALALSISIALDPEHTGAPPAEPTPAPPAEPTPAPPPAPRDEVVPPPATAPSSLAVQQPRQDVAPARRSAESVAVSGSLTALSMLGVAPAPAFGAALDLQTKWGSWALGMGARTARSAAAGVDNGAELTATLLAGQAEGCFQPGLVEYCGVGLLGASWARAGKVDTPRTAQGLFGALGARLGLVAPLSESISLLARGEALAVAWPVQAQVDGSTVWSAPAFAATLATGLQAHFR